MTYSIDAAVARMHTLTSVWDVGYGQGTGVGGRLDIRDGGAGDCSSTVANAINCGYGHALSWNPLPADTYTGNLRPRLLALGWAAHAWGSVALRKGDVVLAENRHVGMMTSSSLFGEFRINERGQITGGTPGDQTGSESREGPVYFFGQQWVLRPPTTTPAASAASTGGLSMSDVSTILEELSKVKVAVGDLRDSKWPDLVKRLDAIEARMKWIDDRVTKTNSAVGKISDGRTDVDANVVSVEPMAAGE